MGILYGEHCTWIGDPSVGDELSEQDSEAPNVRLDGELGVVGGLWSCPLDREPCTNPGNDTTI